MYENQKVDQEVYLNLVNLVNQVNLITVFLVQN